MRTKIFILGLIFLVLIACKKGIESPYSPIIPDPEPIFVGIKEVKITLFIDFTDDSLIPFLNPIYFDHEVNVRIHRDNWPEAIIEEYIRGTGIITKELSKSFGTSPGWQVRTNEYHTVDSRYSVSRIPPEEQEKIRWRFQISIELNDSQYEVKIWAGGKEESDTGWFDGWGSNFWGILAPIKKFIYFSNPMKREG